VLLQISLVGGRNVRLRNARALRRTVEDAAAGKGERRVVGAVARKRARFAGLAGEGVVARRTALVAAARALHEVGGSCDRGQAIGKAAPLGTGARKRIARLRNAVAFRSDEEIGCTESGSVIARSQLRLKARGYERRRDAVGATTGRRAFGEGRRIDQIR